MSHALHDEAGSSNAARMENLTRIVLRPLATPVPLGVLALALGSFLLTTVQLGWIDVLNTPQVATVILVFVVPLELVAAVVAFMIRDVVMATGLGLLTGTWAAAGTLLITGVPGATDQVFGILGIAVALGLLVPAASASWAKPATGVLFVVAAVRFALTGIFQLNAGPYWQTASGIVGLVLVASSTYSAFALSLEDARHHPVLPTGRRSTSAEAMSGNIDEQLETLPTEAGVRQES